LGQISVEPEFKIVGARRGEETGALQQGFQCRIGGIGQTDRLVLMRRMRSCSFQKLQKTKIDFRDSGSIKLD